MCVHGFSCMFTSYNAGYGFFTVDNIAHVSAGLVAALLFFIASLVAAAIYFFKKRREKSSDEEDKDADGDFYHYSNTDHGDADYVQYGGGYNGYGGYGDDYYGINIGDHDSQRHGDVHNYNAHYYNNYYTNDYS